MLGIDFMTKQNVKIDFVRKQMIIRDIKVCALKTDTGYASTVRPTVIEANSEVLIPVKVAPVKDEEEVLLEPLGSLSSLNIIGAKCLVTEKKGKALIRLANPTAQKIYLKGNKMLAIVSPFESSCVYSLSTCSTRQQNTSTSSNLDSKQESFSFDLSDSNLTEQQKLRLLDLLNNNIFSEVLHDLGRTHLQTHEIDTGNAKPVKPPFDIIHSSNSIHFGMTNAYLTLKTEIKSLHNGDEKGRADNMTPAEHKNPHGEICVQAS